MKKLYLLLLTVLTTITFAKAQTDWVTHKADDRISVKFPAEPTEVTPGSLLALDKDSTAYIFTVVDFEKVANVDSATLAPLKNTPEFAAQIKTGMKQTLPDVDLSDIVIGTWKGNTSYTTSGLDSQKRKYDMFMLIIGSKLYSASTITKHGISAEGYKKFVASIALK